MKHRVIRLIIMTAIFSLTALSIATFGARAKRFSARNYKALEVMMEEMQDV